MGFLLHYSQRIQSLIASDMHRDKVPLSTYPWPKELAGPCALLQFKAGTSNGSNTRATGVFEKGRYQPGGTGCTSVGSRVARVCINCTHIREARSNHTLRAHRTWGGETKARAHKAGVVPQCDRQTVSALVRHLSCLLCVTTKYLGLRELLCDFMPGLEFRGLCTRAYSRV